MNPSSFVLIISLLATGCASNPTPYQKEKKKEGYRDLSSEEFDIVSFKANSRTKRSVAELYAQFRAIENCRDKSLHVNVIAVLDRTIEKEILRSTGGGWGPSYGFGMYPYYRHSSFGFGASFNRIYSDSWREVLEYPFIEVYYKCAEKIFRPLVEFKELSSEQIKHLVKDVKGGLQIQNILPRSPNVPTLESGDIILKANGKRVERIYDLIKLFGESIQSVNLEYLRDGDRKFGILKALDVTIEGLADEEKIINSVCSKKGEKKEDLLRERKICR
jgi:hypothetical protein